VKYIRALGAFFFDFFIGDTPELFGVGVVVVGITAGLVRWAHQNALVVIALPVMIVLGVVGSVLLERRRKRR
jgi:hypothetical protein